MEEPRRLLGGEGTEFEKGLLQAALDEQPSSRALRHAAVALAAATGASTFTKTVWAAREFFQPLATKIVAGTVIAGSAAYVATHQMDETPSMPERAALSESAQVGADVIDEHPEEVAELREIEPQPEPTSTVDEAPTNRAQATATPPSATSKRAAPQCNIAQEVKALDGARRNLDSGNASAALNKLDAYSMEFAGGCLGQEALVMRIRALVQSGKRAQARALAESFRSKNPKSPYNKRIDSIVGRRSTK